MEKFILIILLFLFFVSVKTEQQKIYLSPIDKEIFNLSSSTTYLFILEAEAPDMGVLLLTFDKDHYTGYQRYINIYEYSNENCSDFNYKKSVQALKPSYFDGKTEIQYSFDVIESTTHYIGFEIKVDTDMENVGVEGTTIRVISEDDNTHPAAYYFILIIFFFPIIMCIAVIVTLCYRRKRVRGQIQPQINQSLYPEGQNQPLSQYNVP